MYFRIHMLVLVFSLVQAWIWQATSADKILLLPFTWKSHLMQFTAIGNQLTARGHDVTMIVSPTYPGFNKLQEDCAFEVLGYSVVEPDWYTLPKPANIMEMSKMSQIEQYQNCGDPFMAFCSNILKDDALLDSLRKKNFSLILVTSVPFTRCLSVLPYRLGVPFVSITVTFEPWLQRVPALPSFVPFQYSQLYTENMSFKERLHNTWILMKWIYVSSNIPILSDKFIGELTPDKPFLSVSELVARSELWLIDSDILLDYARPMMPNEVFVGGILSQEASTLEEDLARFMDSAEEGVIILSFGGYDALPLEYLDTFLEAFSRVPQHVILRTEHGHQTRGISPKIKLMKWIPQNDLLGHPNTKLFLTHCGGNSQFQALYHGVPMIGFPRFLDQDYNARRVEYHGYGIFLELTTLKPDDLVFWINEIIHHNSSYRDNIIKASALFRSRPEHPLDRVANSLEYVIQHGADHLKSHSAYSLAWYEYLMLDILAIIAGFIMLLTSCFCGILCYCMQRKQIKPKMDKLKKQ